MPDYADWPVRSDSRYKYIGLLGSSGHPVLYNPDEKALYRAYPEEEARELTVKESPIRRLEPAETLGEALETVGEELGWESLSEFAREYLESEE